jgi:hypothetical protein
MFMKLFDVPPVPDADGPELFASEPFIAARHRERRTDGEAPVSQEPAAMR